ncbi:DUF4145 domain-containing protein [Nocardia alni]|uniref:DUF4145 domain-containing protein n=1 Tax=Nocardia alni TaxID=2815723 RepID=UPI001C23D31F|nr:DUF4145 domain-containing protein [Nocardia alni]
MASEATTAPSGQGSDDENDRNPDGLPYTGDPSGPCPRCGRVSNFTAGEPVKIRNQIRISVEGGGSRYLSPQQVVVLTCHGCKQGTVVIEETTTVKLSATTSTVKQMPLYWWPTPGSSTEMADVPDDIAAAFQEGLRCLSVIAPNAAVAMFRNALAHIVKEKGSDAAKRALSGSLASGIAQMVTDGDLLSTFNDWATHIRVVGNAGAHQEAYEAVSAEEAQDLQNLVLGLIRYLYIEPANLARLQKPKKRF